MYDLFIHDFQPKIWNLFGSARICFPFHLFPAPLLTPCVEGPMRGLHDMVAAGSHPAPAESLWVEIRAKRAAFTGLGSSSGPPCKASPFLYALLYLWETGEKGASTP